MHKKKSKILTFILANRYIKISQLVFYFKNQNIIYVNIVDFSIKKNLENLR